MQVALKLLVSSSRAPSGHETETAYVARLLLVFCPELNCSLTPSLIWPRLDLSPLNTRPLSGANAVHGDCKPCEATAGGTAASFSEFAGNGPFDALSWHVNVCQFLVVCPRN